MGVQVPPSTPANRRVGPVQSPCGRQLDRGQNGHLSAICQHSAITHLWRASGSHSLSAQLQRANGKRIDSDAGLAVDLVGCDERRQVFGPAAPSRMSARRPPRPTQAPNSVRALVARTDELAPRVRTDLPRRRPAADHRKSDAGDRTGERGWRPSPRCGELLVESCRGTPRYVRLHDDGVRADRRHGVHDSAERCGGQDSQRCKGACGTGRCSPSPLLHHRAAAGRPSPATSRRGRVERKIKLKSTRTQSAPSLQESDLFHLAVTFLHMSLESLTPKPPPSVRAHCRLVSAGSPALRTTTCAPGNTIGDLVELQRPVRVPRLGTLSAE